MKDGFRIHKAHCTVERTSPQEGQPSIAWYERPRENEVRHTRKLHWAKIVTGPLTTHIIKPEISPSAVPTDFKHSPSQRLILGYNCVTGDGSPAFTSIPVQITPVCSLH